MARTAEKYGFLFSQLIKRDFTLKYKRTILGVLWSALSPLLNLTIMWLMLGRFFGSNVNHYSIYLFSGQLVYSYFCDATNQGMTSLIDNAAIFTKINIPKYLFLLSKNISSLINFCITLILFFVFVAIEGVPFTWRFLLLLFPVVMLVIFNIGVGLILSALFVFFRDVQYLWGIATQLILWLSAVFYSIDAFPASMQRIFFFNPLYLFITYFRTIVIDDIIPSAPFHGAVIAYSLIVLIVGGILYNKNNHQFLYYV